MGSLSSCLKGEVPYQKVSNGQPPPPAVQDTPTLQLDKADSKQEKTPLDPTIDGAKLSEIKAALGRAEALTDESSSGMIATLRSIAGLTGSDAAVESISADARSFLAHTKARGAITTQEITEEFRQAESIISRYKLVTKIDVTGPVNHDLVPRDSKDVEEV